MHINRNEHSLFFLFLQLSACRGQNSMIERVRSVSLVNPMELEAIYGRTETSFFEKHSTRPRIASSSSRVTRRISRKNSFASPRPISRNRILYEYAKKTLRSSPSPAISASLSCRSPKFMKKDLDRSAYIEKDIGDTTLLIFFP